MTVLSVKLFSRPNCLPRKAGRDIYTWHLGGPPSRQHGVQTGWPWKGWWSTMHFRTAEWEEKLLAWHLTTVSMNKTHSTFETKPFKSESVHLCTKTQDHRPAPLLAIKQEAFKAYSFYWDSSLWRNKAVSTASLPFHCGACNPQRLGLLKSFLSYLHMSVKERTPHWGRI